MSPKKKIITGLFGGTGATGGGGLAKSHSIRLPKIANSQSGQK